VRWGVLGTGVVAGAFVDGLAFIEGASLAVVGSRNLDRAQSFAARYGARGVGSYEEVVADPSVDVVYVATTNAQHKDHALLAVAAGKPVLCEKPFALSLGHGEQIVAAARAAGVFCMEAMWMRCSPVTIEVVRRCRDGVVGDVRLVSAQLGFPNEVDPAGRLFDPNGGGALLDLGVYPITFAHAVLGPPRSVRASAVIGATGVDEQVTVSLDYDGGAQAQLAASIRSELANSAEVSGTAGRIRVRPPLVFPHQFDQRLVAPRRAGVTPATNGSWRTRLRQSAPGRWAADGRHLVTSRPTTLRTPGNGYTAEAVEVERCLTLGLVESPLVPLAETLEVLGTLDAIRSSWAD
jgi:predicted dehydrogenase